MKKVDKELLTSAVNKRLNAVLGLGDEPLTKEEFIALKAHLENLEEEYEDVAY